jgi:DNA damage-inducible protein 1
LELPPASTLKDLKGFIEAETGLPAASQSIYLNGQPVGHETQTLEDAGIRDGEMLAVLVRQNRQPPQRPQATRPAPVGQPDPEGVRQQLLMNPQAQAELRQRDPDLAATINDADRWRETFAMRQRSAQDAERERQNQIALLNEDPFNVEAQRKIEELIRQERVVENLEKAYNENPEGKFRDCIPTYPHAYVDSLRPRTYAVHQHRGQWCARQGIRGLWRPSHHHVT